MARSKLHKAQQEVDLYLSKSDEANFDIAQITTKLFASQQAVLSAFQNIHVCETQRAHQTLLIQQAHQVQHLNQMKQNEFFLNQLSPRTSRQSLYKINSKINYRVCHHQFCHCIPLH